MRTSAWLRGLFCATLMIVTSGLSQAQTANATQDTPGGAEDESPPEAGNLEQRVEQLELDLLQMEARMPEQEEEKALEEVTFHGKSRSLQILNPELSAEIDAFAGLVLQDGKTFESPWNYGLVHEEEGVRSGFFIREAAFLLQSVLDPFSSIHINFSIEGGGIALEEAYVTYHAVGPRLQLSLGKFRQLFGVVNRWHRHALDQFDYPMMLKIPFGADGLSQTGLSVDWLMPDWWSDAQELTLQITNSSNSEFLAGDHFSVPSGLVHLKNYWDLSRNTYLELGLTGLAGSSGRSGQVDPDDSTLLLKDDSLSLSWAAGADLTLQWEPVHQAKYRGVLWRTEFLYAHSEKEDQVRHFMGGYSYVEAKAGASLSLGVRGDLATGMQLADEELDFHWQASPYITWWQSEFVRLRVEYNAIQMEGAPLEHRVLLQIGCAAGPHKHERY